MTYNVVSRLRITLVDAVGGGEERVRSAREEAIKDLVGYYSCDEIRWLLEGARQLLEEAVRAYEKAGYENVLVVDATLKTRLLADANNPYTTGLLEVGLAWDPIANLPFIPGSSLKGALASNARRSHSCEKVFGSKDRAADVVVLDSYPVACRPPSLLSPDIVNPHYREVDGVVDEARVRPTPIVYLTVAPGTTFRIAVLKTARAGSLGCSPGDLRRLVEDTLRRGLGAKTSLAYGRFKMP